MTLRTPTLVLYAARVAKPKKPSKSPSQLARDVARRDPELSLAEIAERVKELSGRSISRQAVHRALNADPENVGGRPLADTEAFRLKVQRALTPRARAKAEAEGVPVEQVLEQILDRGLRRMR